MPVVLTSCTNRKRVAPRNLAASKLKPGDLQSVATAWRNKLRSAKDRVEAGDLYCGRAFREAEQAATQAHAGFFIVSAGLGAGCRFAQGAELQSHRRARVAGQRASPN